MRYFYIKVLVREPITKILNLSINLGGNSTLIFTYSGVCSIHKSVMDLSQRQFIRTRDAIFQNGQHVQSECM